MVTDGMCRRCIKDGLNVGHTSSGLGDMLAAGLDAVGITKERVQAVASAVGVRDCGCKKRQEALNALGRKIGIG